MSEKDNGGPAYPCKTRVRVWTEDAMKDAGLPDALAYTQADHSGMSLRDYFAGKALHSIVSQLPRKDDGMPFHGDYVVEYSVQVAYQFADAMLKERAK